MKVMVSSRSHLSDECRLQKQSWKNSLILRLIGPAEKQVLQFDPCKTSTSAPNCQRNHRRTSQSRKWGCQNKGQWCSWSRSRSKNDDLSQKTCFSVAPNTNRTMTPNMRHRLNLICLEIRCIWEKGLRLFKESIFQKTKPAAVYLL